MIAFGSSKIQNTTGESAAQLMVRFAERTGLTSDAPQRRYLWTDAFAVCNFLGLAVSQEDTQFHSLARQLIGSVHEVLGRHRSDSKQSGWLSGLPDDEGQAHPTRGGLRIGKPWPERGLREPFEPELEWNRDGQYFHYLTRWMHALDLTTRLTGEEHFNLWARELAKVAHDAFVYSSAGRPRMVWKMSIDLSRPLIPSMGHHDPLDGYVTYSWLQQTARTLPAPAGPHLGTAIENFASIIDRMDWVSGDALGIGGLLVDGYRISRLRQEGVELGEVELTNVLSGAADGLEAYVRRGELRWPARTRLAFRELGLAIGLHALEELEAGLGALQTPGIRSLLDDLRQFLPVCQEIERFWLEPSHRQTKSWLDHEDINDVMLATCLEPSGYLALLKPGSLSRS